MLMESVEISRVRGSAWWVFVMGLLVAFGGVACGNDNGDKFTEGDDTGASDGDGDGDGDADSDGDGDGDADGDGDGDSDGDGDGDSDGDVDTEIYVNPDTDAVCDDQDIDIEAAPGRLMFLLDMSTSMLEGEPRKLDQANAAISNVVTEFAGQGIEFGLDLFPDGSDDPGGTKRCGVNNDVVIDCAMDNEQAIIDELNETHLTGATPLYCAMENFKDPSYAPQYSGVKGNNILVVVTDGEDNCFTDCEELTQFSDNKVFGELSAELCQDHGIRTVTIGFGQDAHEGQLNAVAANGCTEYDQYLPADDQEELQDALELLAGLVIGCTFTVGKPEGEEVDPNLVNIYFDDEVVLYDEGCAAGKGWSWTSDSHDEVEFCKEACDRLNSGEVTNVSARFGCATQVVV